MDSKGSGYSPTSHKPKRLHKRRPTKLVSSSGLSFNLTQSQAVIVSKAVWPYPRVPGLTGNASMTPDLPTLLAGRAGKPGTPYFDDITSRMGLDHEKCLDMLLPKLQGLVGDYMFDDLSSKKHSNYKVLIKHLRHQFCKVESDKAYATMFLRWDQRAPETEEAYTAELKCIYGKAYLKCDYSAWDEQLLCRFLNDFADQGSW